MYSTKPFQKLLDTVYGDKPDADLEQYLDAKDLKDFHKILRERKYSVGQVDIPYRVINFWHKKGLIPKGIHSGKSGRKFTYLEGVWMNVVMHLQAFKLPVKAIVVARHSVMVWDEKRQTYPDFEYAFVQASFSTLDWYVACLPDGSAGLASSEHIEMAKTVEEPRDLLLISLKSIAKAMRVEGMAEITPEIPLIRLDKEEIALIAAGSLRKSQSKG